MSRMDDIARDGPFDDGKKLLKNREFSAQLRAKEEKSSEALLQADRDLLALANRQWSTALRKTATRQQGYNPCLCGGQARAPCPSQHVWSGGV